MTAGLAFFFCVEPGWLEPQARLLARSIRRFAGRYADSEIHAVQPRAGPAPGDETLACFEETGTRFHRGNWNLKQADQGTSNKVHAAALIEDASAAGTIVFTDTDTAFLDEPSQLDLEPGIDMAVQLTTRGFGGTGGAHDPNDTYWQQVYSACQVPEPPPVPMLISRRTVRGYFNGGLVALRRSAGLAHLWLDYLERIDEFTRERRRYMDQVALAAVAAGRREKLKILPPSYNYNIRERGNFFSALDDLPMSEMVHLHYHAAFSRPGFLQRVRPALQNDTDAYRWLEQWLPLEPVGKRWRHPWRDRLKKLLRRKPADFRDGRLK